MLSNHKETIFYITIGLGTIIVEIANIYGAGICAFVPVMLILVFVGNKAFS